MRPHRTVAAALLFLTLAACGDDDSDAADPPADDDSDTPTVVDGEPGGAEGGLFVEIAFTGGLVPPDFDFRNVPSVVVYEDGTVLVPGATTAQFPGPPVLPLFTGTIEPDVLDELLASAADAGMVSGVPGVGEFADIPIADAAATRVTVVVDGDERVVEAYALAEAGGSDLGQTGLSEEEIAARAALARFVTDVTDAATVAADEPFVPDRYRVRARPPIDPADFDPSVQPNVVDWPSTIDPPPEGACTAITGDAVDAFVAALEQATELTQWTAGDRTFSLVVRPVLPHEPDCPAG
jgi:hypothetical protein